MVIITWYQEQKIKVRQFHKGKTQNTLKREMVEQREHIEMSEIIAKAVAEAMWITIQKMAETQSRWKKHNEDPR